MNSKHFTWLVGIIILVVMLFLTFILAIAIGEKNFTPSDIFRILSEKNSIEYTIISRIRFPRVLLGFSIGGALSLSGVILQGIYRNPLVEPYTLGISGGAALGVANTIVFGLNVVMGDFMLPVSGFTGAIVIIFLIYLLSVSQKHININRMLLIGIMISFMASSAMMFLLSITTSENLNNIIFWIMGSLDEPNMFLIQVVLFSSIIALCVSYLFTNQLNALRLGESKARHLGINTNFAIRILFIITSLLTGICVSVAGVIGFVGLIIPHLFRLIFGSDFRILLLSSFIGGGIFLVLCDLISRTLIAPNELPIGVITGIIGGFVFITVLGQSKNKIQ